MMREMSTTARPRPRWKSPLLALLLALAAVAGVAVLVFLVQVAPLLVSMAIGSHHAQADATSFCDAVPVGSNVALAQRLAGERTRPLLHEPGSATWLYRVKAPAYNYMGCQISVDARGTVTGKEFLGVGRRELWLPRRQGDPSPQTGPGGDAPAIRRNPSP